jgi:hypothetical protein
MRTLFWKIRYVFWIRKFLRLPLAMCWEMAGSTIESYGDDIEIWSPKSAAEDERDEWRACC